MNDRSQSLYCNHDINDRSQSLYSKSPAPEAHNVLVPITPPPLHLPKRDVVPRPKREGCWRGLSRDLSPSPTSEARTWCASNKVVFSMKYLYTIHVPYNDIQGGVNLATGLGQFGVRVGSVWGLVTLHRTSRADIARYSLRKREDLSDL